MISGPFDLTGKVAAASKGGIVQFARSCAVAWAADNVQVNAVRFAPSLSKKPRQMPGL
jgi:NAD(P)-dependent dehydrogenase (short-subunit alcohol dehydrogenase family)